MQDLTKLTAGELTRLDYKLELDEQHYQDQQRIHGDDTGVLEATITAIREERATIDNEWDRRENEGKAFDETELKEFA